MKDRPVSSEIQAAEEPYPGTEVVLRACGVHLARLEGAVFADVMVEECGAPASSQIHLQNPAVFTL